jgi:hypothetical protein
MGSPFPITNAIFNSQLATVPVICPIADGDKQPGAGRKPAAETTFTSPIIPRKRRTTEVIPSEKSRSFAVNLLETGQGGVAA